MGVDVLSGTLWTVILKLMKLRYETGTATLAQFIIMSFFGIAGAFDSSITTCQIEGKDCLFNAITSILFFILTALWFGAIWVLGYAAEERRSHRLAYVLIAVEGLVLLVATFNAQNHPNTLSLITSLLDIALALWVILLAFRISRAKGGRIVTSERARRRKHTIS